MNKELKVSKVEEDDEVGADPSNFNPDAILTN